MLIFKEQTVFSRAEIQRGAPGPRAADLPGEPERKDVFLLSCFLIHCALLGQVLVGIYRHEYL